MPQVDIQDQRLNRKLTRYKYKLPSRIDYNAFREFIDAIGGVEMTIENNMYYDDEGQNLHLISRLVKCKIRW